MPLGGLVPETYADSRRDSARTAAPLLGPVARKRQSLERAHSARGRKPRNAHEPRIHHAFYPRNRERRFRYGRGKNNLSPRERGEHFCLLFFGKSSVKRQHLDIGMRKLLCRASDFAFAREKHEYVAIGQGKRSCHAARHRNVSEIFSFDRIHPPFGAHMHRPGDRRNQSVRIERRRHHRNAKIWPEHVSRLPRESEGEIAGERALVEFVEYDKPCI